MKAMKILLVEDDVLFRELLDKALGKLGHETTLAADGIEAVQKAQSHKFDMVITDIFMPKKEGIEIIQEIREMHPEIKIIAISSDGQAGYTSFLKIAQAMGADACMEKPFSPPQLIDTIESLVG